MAWLLIRHKVEDYARWKPAFDGHAPARKAAGSKGGLLLRAADDRNDIVMAIEVDDVAKAREFVESEDLRDAMKSAGAAGAPTIWLLETIEKIEA